MAALAASVRPLPADLAITDRSRKFYDGTYKWDANGFIDEHGVYREYDCLDALARAPTPLPPMCLDNEETDSELDPADTEAVQSQGSSNTITPTHSAPVGRTAPYQRPGTTSTGAPVPQTPKSIHRFTIDLLNRPPQSKATARSEANESSSHDINAVSRFEATVGGSEQANAVEMLHRSYELCDGPAPAKRKSSSVQMPDTPPDSPVKGASWIKNTSPASTISTLSPVPFNLSAQDEDRDTTIKSISVTHDIPSLPSTPSKTSPPRKRGESTRGAAQKVAKRYRRRAPASNTGLPKREENSMKDFTLLELHSRAFIRKSARQAKSEGK